MSRDLGLGAVAECHAWRLSRVPGHRSVERQRRRANWPSALKHAADRAAFIRSRPRPTTILCEPDEHTILPMLKLTKNIPCRDEGDCGLAPKAVSSNTLPFAP